MPDAAPGRKRQIKCCTGGFASFRDFA